MKEHPNTHTICAISTPQGNGAIAVIRLSGNDAISIADSIFVAPVGSKKLEEQKPNSVHYGRIIFEEEIIDEVIVAIFKSPHSYTGEDVIEISCHGSAYIQQKVLQILTIKGAVLAKPGEFSMRAFLNGKMDLSQTEAVADLIASESAAAHKMAINQIRGGFSKEIKALREKLLHFCSLIELELDFSEEDVEFANRADLNKFIAEIKQVIAKLTDSFALGNVIKNGVPVTIAGRPNVGKSTLLNTLLQDEKAIVSEIAGTTRDAIEDEINIEGIRFRFIDTAGIRHTTDTIESIGIERTFLKLSQARIILLLADANQSIEEIKEQIAEIKPTDDQQLIVLINKIDLFGEAEALKKFGENGSFGSNPTLYLSAKHHIHTKELTQLLLNTVKVDDLDNASVIVSNVRHYEALSNALEATNRVIEGLQQGLSNDLITIDIHSILYHLGEITGEISTDDILGSIFRNFCIGK